MVRAVHARVPHYAALKQRNARSTTSLRSICRKLRNDVVERAIRHSNAAERGAHARNTRAPCTGARM
eukprot:5242440-Lingulodinium_polyedra.AAC.1